MLRLKSEVGGEGVDGDRAARMGGLGVVARDEDVWRLYVVLECEAGKLIGDVRGCASCYGCGCLGYEDFDGPFMVGRQIQLWHRREMSRLPKCLSARLRCADIF